MEYFFSKILHTNFDDAKTKVIEALKTDGFGIINMIDMQSNLKEKLDVDFKKYHIL